MDFIYQPWPWYVAGPAIAAIMFLLLYAGKSFGMSDNLRTLCTIAGGKNFSDYFKIDWKTKTWNLVFSVGAVLGGFIAHRYLTVDDRVNLNPKTVTDLENLGFSNPGSEFLPPQLFSLENLTDPKVLIILIVGGFLVGFGTRYAGGCTSGHAISGLSNLQVPSLIAVIGFFAGGLLMIHLFFPLIFNI